MNNTSITIIITIVIIITTSIIMIIIIRMLPGPRAPNRPRRPPRTAPARGTQGEPLVQHYGLLAARNCESSHGLLRRSSFLQGLEVVWSLTARIWPTRAPLKTTSGKSLRGSGGTTCPTPLV